MSKQFTIFLAVVLVMIFGVAMYERSLYLDELAKHHELPKAPVIK